MPQTSDGRSSPATIDDTTPALKAGTLFKKSSRRTFQKSTKANMAQPGEPSTQSGQIPPKEESFVKVSEAPTMDLNGKNLDDTDGKPDGRWSAQKQSAKDDSDRPTTEVSGDVSYAGALKDGSDRSNGGQERNASRETPGTNGTQDSPQDRANHSDDSYPDIDPLGLEEHTHQPPPQIRPYEKIRWAPFNVPTERRLQTLAVVVHSVSIIGTVSMFFALCANPFAWPVLIIYLLHILTSKAATDGSLRFRSEWFRSSYLWDLFAGYFPAKLHKTHDLPPTRKYIFGYHPHGIISHGAWAAFVTDALDFSQKFPGITNSLLTLDSNFRIPLYRDYILAMGVRSVSKDSIVNILSRGGANNEGMGRAVTIVIGGARESLEAQPGLFRLILKQRKGFIKVAVRTGADLVPVLAFGENDLYEQLQPNKHPLVHQVQMFVLRVWKFTLPFLHGRGIFNYDVGLMPFRHPLNIVVGAPIKVQQSSNPSQEEIDRLHGLYVDELQKIWDRYKDEFAPDRKEEMQIV